MFVVDEFACAVCGAIALSTGAWFTGVTVNVKVLVTLLLKTNGFGYRGKPWSVTEMITLTGMFVKMTGRSDNWNWFAGMLAT